MIIRKSTESDLEEICRIYEYARAFMRGHGNPNQWKDTNPPPEVIGRDINSGKSYVCVRDSKPVAVFYFSVESEPTYAVIEGGWLNDEPYGVVHRIARSEGAEGAGSFCINWCFEQCHNLRVDTHRDNAPMRRLLEKAGFTECGTIWLANGDERLAFQKTL